MEFYGHMIARLDGGGIEKDFDRYSGFVQKGIAGFIVFGGELGILRKYIGKLQDSSPQPLIIASDLEQGLGQQVKGGTIFPPAMALSSAYKSCGSDGGEIMRRVFGAYAEESLYAGINTILAPVVDINTNPHNPVISVRSFGEDGETVSLMSGIMIETLQSNGIVACAKHFPGHGDTSIDSHISLPVLNKGMGELEEVELLPFKKAVAGGVRSMMLAHISVPSIDKTGVPLSISGKAVEYIRNRLGFNGMLMTDALNMGGILSTGRNKAGEMALNAGVDILLHPADPDELNDHLKGGNRSYNIGDVEDFRRGLMVRADKIPDFRSNASLAEMITWRSIQMDQGIGDIKPTSVVIVKEDKKLSCGIFEGYLRERFAGIKYFRISDDRVPGPALTGNNVLTVIFSTTAAWKGNMPEWFNGSIQKIKDRTRLFVVFGNPYVVHEINKPKVLTFWCSEQAERAAVKKMEEFHE